MGVGVLGGGGREGPYRSHSGVDITEKNKKSKKKVKKLKKGREGKANNGFGPIP